MEKMTITPHSDLEKSLDDLMQKIADENKKRVTTENHDHIISPNHYASDKGFEVFDV